MEHRKPRLPQRAVSRYRNPHLLSQGSTGALFHAFDATLQRDVALKTITTREAKKEERKEQFLRRAKLLQEVDNVYVAKVLEVVAKDDEPYYVTQFIDGLTLGKTIEVVDYTVSDLMKLLTNCAAGLAALHERGFIHGNITLDSIVVNDDDHPYVCRFGLAREAINPEVALRTGSLPTAYRFIPPEVLKGEKHDELGDLYQLAFVAYEAITHIKPYSCDAIYEYVTKGKEPQLLPPSCLRKGIDGKLDKLILGALQVDRTQRTESVEEFYFQCMSWLDRNHDEPPLHPPTPPESEARKKHHSSSFSVRRFLRNAPSRWHLSRKKKLLLAALTAILLFSLIYAKFGERIANHWRKPCRVTEISAFSLDKLKIKFDGERSGYAILTIPPSGQYHITFHRSYQGETTVNLSRALIEQTPAVVTYLDNEPPMSFQVDPRPIFDELLRETVNAADEFIPELTEGMTSDNPRKVPTIIKGYRGGLRLLVAKKLKSSLLGSEMVTNLRPLRILGTLARQGYLHSPPWGNIDALLNIALTPLEIDDRPSVILLASHFDEKAPNELKSTIGQRFSSLPPRRVYLHKKTIGPGHTAWPLLGAKLVIHTTSFDERLALSIAVNGRKPFWLFNASKPSGNREKNKAYVASGVTIEAPLDLALFQRGDNAFHITATPIAPEMMASFFLPIAAVEVELW